MTDLNHYKTPSAPLPAAWLASDDEQKGSWLKKLLMGLGIVFAVLLLGVLAAIGAGVYFGRGLDKSSHDYADAAVPAITAHWDAKELDSRMSPELRVILKPGDAEKLFAMLGKLGALKEYKGASGQANIGYYTKPGKVVSARYIARAEFEHGSAEILLSLIQHDGQWQIIEFRVNSPLFMQPG